MAPDPTEDLRNEAAPWTPDANAQALVVSEAIASACNDVRRQEQQRYAPLLGLARRVVELWENWPDVFVTGCIEEIGEMLPAYEGLPAVDPHTSPVDPKGDEGDGRHED